MPELACDPEALKPLAVSDSGFVFDPRTGHSYNLNGCGLATLKGLRDGLAVSDIVVMLRETFDGGTSIQDDVESFVRRLRELGLINPVAHRVAP